MQIKPIIENYNPQYPNSNEVKDIGKVLNNKKPKRWQYKPYINIAFASMALFGLNNCSSFDKIAAEKYKKLGINDSIYYVAPLFEHGKGIGTFGCMIVTPPTFLNEDEAKKIIIDEFDDYGLELTRDSLLVNSVVHLEKKTKTIYNREKRAAEVKDSIYNFDLNFIAVNKERNFAVFYISEKVYLKIIGLNMKESTIITHDYKELAQNIINTLKANKMHGVVFYEPFTDKLKYSKDSLRSQIKDFINWFKQD